MPDRDPLLSFGQAAAYLHCSERHIYRLVDETRELEAEKHGGRGRGIRESELDRYLDERKGEG